MQLNNYHQLKNKTVRDLYWLLFSESPLSDNYDLSPYSLFPKEILNQWQLASEEYFLALDKKHYEIENFVKRKKNKRLGFYAEALLSYFFQTFKQVELLLQNFQIIDQQKTIGEVDFIIRYNEKVIHLECAVKYYILKDLNKKNDPSQWVGPRLKDNLELKLNKIIQHQLPLGSRTEILNKINFPIDCSFLFLKGIFFAEEKTVKGEINRSEPNAFIRQNNLIKAKEKPINILTRPNWLSATKPSELKKQNQFNEDYIAFRYPELVLFNDGHVRFIVPSNWGKN